MASDVREIYARYCDIVSRSDHERLKELVDMISKSLELRGHMRDGIFHDLSKLMSWLDLSVDSRQFNCFYDFVFFACRENGQKNITVSRAISAWRLVLTGRFRLLNQWCNFVEGHQKHNISEDSWKQLLAFSRCVNEDLEGYDPKGAWPVLIDDFVDHMYRISQSKNCSAQEFCSSCGDMETPGITNTFSGLNLLPGSKRKLFIDSGGGQWDATPMSCDNSANPENVVKPKRARQMHHKRYGFRDLDSSYMSASDVCAVDSPVDSPSDVGRLSPLGCHQTPVVCRFPYLKALKVTFLSVAVFSSTGRADCHTQLPPGSEKLEICYMSVCPDCVDKHTIKTFFCALRRVSWPALAGTSDGSTASTTFLSICTFTRVREVLFGLAVQHEKGRGGRWCGRRNLEGSGSC